MLAYQYIDGNPRHLLSGISRLTMSVLRMLGKILFVIVLQISGSCQSMVYRSMTGCIEFPYMRYYRSVDESTCFRCHQPVYLPGSLLYRVRKYLSISLPIDMFIQLLGAHYTEAIFTVVEITTTVFTLFLQHQLNPIYEH